MTVSYRSNAVLKDHIDNQLFFEYRTTLPRVRSNTNTGARPVLEDGTSHAGDEKFTPATRGVVTVNNPLTVVHAQHSG